MHPLSAPKPPSQDQLRYLDHLLQQQGLPRPDNYDALSSVDVSALIDGLKRKRGRPVWYGNGQFSHWEHKTGSMIERVTARYKGKVLARDRV